METKKPRVLVTTVGSWNSRVGSDTMSSLMGEYGAENVAALYIRAEKSDSKSASRYFHIMEGRVMKSILKRSTKTGEEFRPEEISVNEKNNDITREKALYGSFKNNRWGIFLFAREFVWKLGHWKTKELDDFLDDFKPEVLVCPIESYIHFNSINEYIIKRCNPCVIGFLWDDNFTYKQDHGFWHQIHRWWLRKSVRSMVRKCNTVFAVSPKMKQECDTEFGIESKLLTKPIFNKAEFEPVTMSTPIKLIYTGKLIIGRDVTISEVVKAVRKINENGQKVILDVYTNTLLTKEMEAKINVPGCCNLHDPIPQSEVFKLQKEADVLIFAESLSDKKLAARLSFSTKLTDYFAAGKCVWGIGNEDLGPISYLQTEDAGLVSTNIESIHDVLEKFYTDSSIVEQYAKKSYDCGQRNHNAQDILNRFYTVINNN